MQREGVECTIDEAQSWVDAFYDNYQNVAKYIAFCKNSVEDPGYLDTPYGRRRHFQMTKNRAAVAAQQREACNFPIQSTVADSLSEALVHLYRERNRLGMRFRIVLAIHDAAIIEVPYEEARQARDLLCFCLSDLTEVPSIGLHYGVDVEIFDRWNEKVSPDVLACCGL